METHNSDFKQQHEGRLYIHGIRMFVGFTYKLADIAIFLKFRKNHKN